MQIRMDAVYLKSSIQKEYRQYKSLKDRLKHLLSTIAIQHIHKYTQIFKLYDIFQLLNKYGKWEKQDVFVKHYVPSEQKSLKIIQVSRSFPLVSFKMT